MEKTVSNIGSEAQGRVVWATSKIQLRTRKTQGQGCGTNWRQHQLKKAELMERALHPTLWYHGLKTQYYPGSYTSLNSIHGKQNWLPLHGCFSQVSPDSNPHAWSNLLSNFILLCRYSNVEDLFFFFDIYMVTWTSFKSDSFFCNDLHDMWI